MSCNACGSQDHTPQTPVQQALGSSLCAPGLSFTTNESYLLPYVGGVPATPVDLEKLVKYSETDTRLRFDPTTCALHYTGEKASNDCGDDDIITVPTMLSCASIRDLKDVSDTPPANDGDLLVWNEANGEWEPYTVVSGVASNLLSLDDNGRIVKAGSGSNLGCVLGGLIQQDSISGLVGVNANGCLVKASGGVSCFLGANTPAGVIQTVAGIDANGCLVKDATIISRLNSIDGRVWGACNVNLPMFGFGASIGRTSGLSSGNRRATFGSFTIPDVGCPVKVMINLTGYVDTNPSSNGPNRPFHLNVELALDNPSNIFTYADHWHDAGVPGTSGTGWSDSSSSTAVLYLSGAHTVFLNIFTDINPSLGGAIFDLFAQGSGSVIMVRQ